MEFPAAIFTSRFPAARVSTRAKSTLKERRLPVPVIFPCKSRLVIAAGLRSAADNPVEMTNAASAVRNTRPDYILFQ